jgi:mannitol 2-dehydrogenase
LNGTHCALGYVGSLAGHSSVSDAVADPLIAAYVKRLMNDEVAPLLARHPDDPIGYAASVRARLMNTAITDPLSRLRRNGSVKVPAHLLSSIADSDRSGRRHPLLTLAAAAWCRYLRGGTAARRPRWMTRRVSAFDGWPVPAGEIRAGCLRMA